MSKSLRDATLNLRKLELEKYLEPLLPLMRGGSLNSVKQEIEDKPVQAVVARQENRNSLCSLLLRTWYPYRYRIVAIEELNTVAAGPALNDRMIEDFVETSEYFIVDLSNIDEQRARSRFGLYDDMALVRFIKVNMDYRGFKVILILDRRMRVITRAFPEFWTFAGGNGIEVFDKGKYLRIGTAEAGHD